MIVVRSYGAGAFCAGASFDELSSIRDAVQGKAFFMGFARVIGAMMQSAKPIVVRVHGKAVGGGVGIVAAADYAIATSNASVRLSELAVGIGPFVVGPAIERKIGTGAFGAMAIDADWRDAAWAERHGLYARVVEDTAALDAEVDRRVAALAAANPEAVNGHQARGVDRNRRLVRAPRGAGGDERDAGTVGVHAIRNRAVRSEVAPDGARVGRAHRTNERASSSAD